MKNILLTSIAASAAIAASAMLSLPSSADTVTDNQPAYKTAKVNRAAKADLALKPTSKAFKSYHSRSSIKAFDRRYKVPGQGNFDPR